MLDLTLHNRYRLESELGQGGMGTVYKAFDTLLDRPIAIKLLNQQNLATDSRERLLREARAAARLNHPNIVAIYDVGGAEAADEGEPNGSMPFIVMEMVEGQSLYDRPPETLGEVLRIASQMCAALDHAHTHGVVHRDLKLENILITKSGLVKLTDFGLARSVSSRLTTEGVLVGTVFYLAPELALGQAYDGRADLYALGVLLYELTTHRLPFDGDDPLAVISQHLHAPVVAPRAIKPDLPPALDALIVQLLAKKPEDRPGTAAEVKSRLDQINLSALPAEPAVEEAEQVSLLDRIVRGRLIGREREMAEAAGTWRRARDGEAQVLLISGEPGIGKSRLARELIALAEVSGGRVLTGESYAEGGAPYAPIAQLIQGSMAGKSRLPLSALALGDLLTLAPAMRARFPEARQNPALDPQAEQQRIFESVVEWALSLSAQGPTLLLVDDAHWADNGTLALLRHLARRSRSLRLRLLMVLTYRETELDEQHALNELLADLNRDRLTKRIKLGRLTQPQTGDMLTVMFESAAMPDFLNGIFRETEGNPFFIEEVCKALIEDGQLVFGEGGWQRPNMAEVQVPQSIRLAIQARVGKLPQTAQDALRLAAAFGREFDFDLLQRATELPEDALVEALDQAVRAQLIGEAPNRPPAGAERFAFAHVLIPAALRDGVSGLRRHRLHRKVAAALEALRPEDFETLAYQHAEAGDEEQARAYYIRAGARAQKVFANADAIKFYSEALALYTEDDPARFEVLAARAAVYDVTADRPAQKANAEALVAVAEKINDNTRRFEAYLVLADMWAELDMAQASKPAEQALTLARSFLGPVEEARALQRLGGLDTMRGNYTAARAGLTAAAERFKEAGLRAEAAASLHMLSLALGRSGQLSAAKQAAEDSIELSRAAGDRRQEAIGLRRLGIMVNLEGDVEASLRYTLEALALHRAIGDRTQEMNALANLPSVYAELGLWDEALTYARQTMELSDAIDSTEGMAKGIQEISEYYYRARGDYGGGLRFLNEQLARERVANDEILSMRVKFARGVLLAQLGQGARVVAEVREFLPKATRLSHPYIADALSFIAFVEGETGQLEQALRTQAEAEAMLGTEAGPPERANALVTRAYIDLLAGFDSTDTEIKREVYWRGVGLAEEALKLLEASASQGLPEFRGNILGILACLLAELGEGGLALEKSVQAIEILERKPTLWIRAPEQILWVHARALRMNGRTQEADVSLERAYARFKVVLDSLEDELLRQSWQTESRFNRMLLADVARYLNGELTS